MENVEIIYKVDNKLRKMETLGYLDYLEESAAETLAIFHQKPIEIIRIHVKG